ncbi:M14 family zinc carboxypeptidase [Lentibacillus salinarum]|uniref:M14 family zinc carboxypeptidase n=1 Tax=Lentibacillus salinarum TaxID=446820 RepID=A0ABW3ZTX8_9BACI
MKKVMTAIMMGVLVFGGMALTSPSVLAVGNGPGYGGNENVNTSMLHTYSEMVDFLEKQETKQKQMALEEIGQTVQGRDIHLVKYMNDPDNPTVLYLAQQHGNEALNTEGMLNFIKHLGTGKYKDVLDGVNILLMPMYNADGAMGDVNFSLEDYVADGDRHLTRYNANEVDLNRDHIAKEQPESQALHNNVLSEYDIDYMVDMHHQGVWSERDGDLVSGSMLHPTADAVDQDVLHQSKQLGAVVFDAIEPKGWGHIGKYQGGTGENIGRNGIAVQYDISTLLLEMRGMADHYYEPYVLGQKSNGYLIKQATTALEATANAIADGSVNDKDVSFWDSLSYQETRPNE